MLLIYFCDSCLLIEDRQVEAITEFGCAEHFLRMLFVFIRCAALQPCARLAEYFARLLAQAALFKSNSNLSDRTLQVIA